MPTPHRLTSIFRKGVWGFLFSALLLQADTKPLQLSISSYPSRLNPLLATDSASSSIADWLFSGLLKYDKEARIVPDMAENFYFKDSKTLIITLQKGLKWHDGVEITAEDVLFTFDTIRSPKLFTPYTSSFRNVEKVELIDRYTVKITHKKAYFKALETWMSAIIPKHILENDPDLMTSRFNQHPVGSNSYTLEGFEIGKDMVLNAFDAYLPHPPHIGKVIYRYVQDPSTEFLMLQSFQLDVGSLTPLQVERQIDARFKEHYHIVEQPAKAYTYLGFNLKRKPFDDLRIRQAIRLAVDKQELVDILFFGHGEACYGPFLEGAVGFNPKAKAPATDYAKARALLKELGYDAAHPLRFTITTNADNPTRRYAAEILQNQLAKAGIEVTIKTMEWQAFLQRVVHGRDFDTVLLGWSLPLMPDPFNVWHSSSDKKGGFNFIGYNNPEADRIIENAESLIDRDQLDQAFQKLFGMIVEDAPYIFLYIPNAITVVNKAVSPIEPSITGIWHNKNEWIKR